MPTFTAPPPDLIGHLSPIPENLPSPTPLDHPRPPSVTLGLLDHPRPHSNGIHKRRGSPKGPPKMSSSPPNPPQLQNHRQLPLNPSKSLQNPSIPPFKPPSTPFHSKSFGTLGPPAARNASRKSGPKRPPNGAWNAKKQKKSAYF